MTVRSLVTALALVLLATTPLFGEVFAQSDDTQEDDLLIANQTDEEVTVSIDEGESTSTDAVPEETTVTALPAEKWFRTSMISGNINVGDFVVGPGRAEIFAEPGETVVREITVTNRISDGRRFKIEVEDITGSADGSKAVGLTGAERGPYSIRDYISFPEYEFELKLGERALIPITINIPPDAEPGGYYGSVLISTIQTKEQENEGSTMARNPIIARVGSLIFLTVDGDITREGSVTEVKPLAGKWWYESGPIELGVLYENTGSVHLNPYGELSVTNMMGEEVGFVELEPWFVLPKSLRIREITWDREFLFGRYTVSVKVNRGYGDIVDEVSTTFWVLPWKLVGGVFLGLFIVIFLIRAFFRNFEFKRKES